MKQGKQNNLMKKLKTEVFHFILIIDQCTITNKFLVLLISLSQLLVLPYFYINPHFTYLNHFTLFSQYFKFVDAYFFHIKPFASSLSTAVILALYPFIIVLVLLAKKLNRNKILTFIVQIASYIFPLISVKITIQLIHALTTKIYLQICIPMGIISLAFGALLLILNKRIHRYTQLPIIIALQLGINYYVILVFLLFRLVILAYLFYPGHTFILTYLFEVGYFVSLLFFIYSTDSLLNYLSFIVFAGALTAYGLFTVFRSFSKKVNIYEHIQNLEDDQNEIFDVLEIIERHEIQCNKITCKCHKYVQIEPQKLKNFVYQYEEERLKSKCQFEDMVYYAKQCCQRYEFKLSGLIKIYRHRPNSLYQQYIIFKICDTYQYNLRKQDKDHKIGELYFNIHEEQHDFSRKIQQILEMIRVFWNLVLNFDGSQKFLKSIRSISQSIVQLKQTYQAKRDKYDQEAQTFTHLMQLFQNIILNEKVSEEDELTAPQEVIFIVTNQDTIINANNNFAILANKNLEHLINKNYYQLIPEIYRDAHKVRLDQYIQKIEDYDSKSLSKFFSTGTIQIKMVEMTHKVLPRFMNGLEIFTRIQYPVKTRKHLKDSFVFIIQKDSFFIKNVEPIFFEVIRFKINQRNIKILEQMALSSIFQHFTITSNSSANAQTKIFPHFLQEFTYMKKPQQSKDKRIIKAQQSTPIKFNKTDEFEQVYQYEILKSLQKEEPYLKVLFTVKSAKEKPEQKASQSSLYQYDSSPTEQQQPTLNFKSKEVQFITPFYMAVFLVALHFIYLNISGICQNTFDTIQKRYQFYFAFDSSILSSLNIVVGQQAVIQLQSLWIQGYGDFSQSFNTFLNVKQPLFSKYFNQSVSTQFHNSLYLQIQDFIKKQLSSMQNNAVLLLILVLAGVFHYFVDFFFALKYIFRIEAKVGELLLQFVIISDADITKLLAIIDNFLENILNLKCHIQKTYKMPKQTVEQSALQLMKGGSLNFSLQQEQDQNWINDKKSSQGRRRSSTKTQRKKLQKSIFVTFKQDIQSIRSNNITLFKQGYQNCSFIIKRNKKLFLMVLLSLIVSCILFFGLLYLIYFPTQQFQTQVSIFSQLQQSRIILMKSLQQIAINNYTLLPNNTISNNLISIQTLLGKLNKSSLFADYYSQFLYFSHQDACKVRNITMCTILSSQLKTYGLGVVTSAIEEYFRVKNKSALYINSTSNNLILYEKAVFDILIVDFLSTCQRYNDQIKTIQLNYVIFGSIVLFLALLASHLSLKQFKNRIQDSQSLLKIIPKQVKDKKLGNLQSQYEQGQ